MFPLSPEFMFGVAMVAVNGAVTWGILSTKLDFLRRDVDLAHRRIDRLDERMRWPSASAPVTP